MPHRYTVTPREVLALCREKEVKAVDLRFCDLLGTWQHFTIPVGRLDEGVFEDGLGFDGSSIRGWQGIHESDMLVLPQAGTALVDPLAAVPTLAMIASVQDPVTGEPYSRDPRHIATKAANYLRHTGIADVAYFGPEAEFFVFDSARFESSAHEAYYHLASEEGQWSRGAEGAGGYKLRHKEGYFPCPPADTLMDLRTEMMQAMLDCGLEVEAHHHEVASGGQCEIDLAYQPLVTMADWVLITNTAFATWPSGGARRRPLCPSRCLATTAAGCTSTFRFGRTRSRCSPAAPTRASRKSACTPSAASCGMRQLCWR